MIYFSEISGKKVIADDNKVLGRLKDIAFVLRQTPYITKILVQTPKKELLLVPAENILKINHKKIDIRTPFKQEEMKRNEALIRKNLLDTQVIDIKGSQVVRVNDVLIQQVGTARFEIYGVDIGFMGILRWFGLEKFLDFIIRLLKINISPSILAWSGIQPLELSRGRVVLNFRFDKIRTVHPADLADYLATQNFKNILNIIKGMDREYLGRMISNLNPNFRIKLLRRMGYDNVASIISAMDPDDAVDVFLQFSPKKREIIFDKLKELDEKEASEIRRLLKLSKTPLGRFLNSDVLTVEQNQTAGMILNEIRQKTEKFSLLHYVYVTDRNGVLKGVINIHELLLADLNMPVFKFMTQNPVVVYPQTSAEMALRRMIKYKVFALPVVCIACG